MAIFQKIKNSKPSSIKKEKVEAKKITSFDRILPILLPHTTEKAAGAEIANKYIFRVPQKTTTGEIREEFIARFNIKPLRINIVQATTKARRRGAFVGYKVGYKKAVVTLPKDKKIDIVPK